MYDLTSFINNQQSLIEPIVITRSPIIKSSSKLNIWKEVIIDVDTSIRYKYGPVNDITSHDMVISLLSWSELNSYDLISYSDNVQKSGKIFIHFPINEKTYCHHNYIDKSVCREGRCGIFVPFDDINAIISIILSYMNMGKKILLHSHKDINRMLLFIGCGMVQDDYEIEDVINIMKNLDLTNEYIDYIKAYNTYLE